MAFLRLLEKIRNPFLDNLFLIITAIGEETVFLLVAVLVFWCVNKREGYYLLTVGLVGMVTNQFLKQIFKIERPWTKEGFEAVPEAIGEAGGYSFPSGHTQNVTGTLGSVARWSDKRWVRVTSVSLIILVALSRMYLGVHTPLDVGFSLAFGALLVFAIYPIFKTEERFKKFMPYIVAFAALLAVALLLFAMLYPDAKSNVENLASCRKNAATALGCTLGLIPVYILDRCVIRFETGARWYSQLIKLVVGIAIVLLIKEGLKAPLGIIFPNEYVARCVRYFAVVIFVGVLWPLTFGYFSRLKIVFLDNLFKKKNNQ